MTIPHRGTTSESTYFVTANVEPRRNLFQVEKVARLFIEVLRSYREQKKYLLHEFVLMPDHLHLILTPTGITLERAMQLVKGGFSFQLNKNLKAKRDIWQPSFADRRVRDSLEYAKFKDYIWQNPVKRGLVRTAEEYPYSSAHPSFRDRLDPVPQRLKPISLSALRPAPPREASEFSLASKRKSRGVLGAKVRPAGRSNHRYRQECLCHKATRAWRKKLRYMSKFVAIF